jgi:hypothetical protein
MRSHRRVPEGVSIWKMPRVWACLQFVPDQGVLELDSQGLQVDLVAALLADQVEAALDGVEGGEGEDVELDQADGLDVAHGPLGDHLLFAVDRSAWAASR